MLTRLALVSDIDEVVAMARHNAETMPHVEFSEDRVRQVFASYLAEADPTIWVCEDRRNIVGFMAAGMCSYDFADGFFVTQRVIYVKPEHRGSRAATSLVRELIAWADRIGAKEIVGGNDNSFNSERTARFLEHYGFERCGVYLRRVGEAGGRKERQ